MARLSFFQFLNVNMGNALLELLTFNGWPTKEEWNKYEMWWDKNVTIVNEAMTRRGEKGFTPTWHFKVKRISEVAT